MKPKFGQPGFNLGESNPSFKGKEAGYAAIHAWVRRRKLKPKLCENCKTEPPRDLANTSGKYLRDLEDWKYLCRRCHMDSDDRNNRLRESGKSRKLSNKICRFCNNEFHPLKESANFCNRKCYSAAGGRFWKEKRA
jgi:hypothetical protein